MVRDARKSLMSEQRPGTPQNDGEVKERDSDNARSTSREENAGGVETHMAQGCCAR